MIFCFRARNDDTYSLRLLKEETKTNREIQARNQTHSHITQPNNFIGTISGPSDVASPQSKGNKTKVEVDSAVIESSHTWCKTEQF